jgi:hypothetical protein
MGWLFLAIKYIGATYLIKLGFDNKIKKVSCGFMIGAGSYIIVKA